MRSISSVEADLGTGTISYRNWAYSKRAKRSFFVSLLQPQLLLKWKLD